MERARPSSPPKPSKPSRPPMSVSQPGEIDDRYVVDGFLRPGRHGDEWRAHRKEDSAVVELKLLKPELFKNGEAIRRFQREVRLLLAFEHPYLLQVLDHGKTPNGDPFLVLEHQEGRLLSELVHRGPLDIDRVRRIGAQIARVLSAAAARGIVHRGLSPEAILVAADSDDVKVLDFGLAITFGTSEFPPSEFGADCDEPRLTEHGQRIGDPIYMAPEYIREFTSDSRTDLYALGVLLYELLTGDPPFRGRPMDVLDAHVSRTPLAPSTHVPAVPLWLDAVVLGLLEKEPAARPDAKGVARSLVAGVWPPPDGSEVTGPIPPRFQP
jgi:serine/threonine protein kinase